MSRHRSVDQFTGSIRPPDKFWEAIAEADINARNHEHLTELIAELRCRLDEVTAERDHLAQQLAETSQQGG